MAATVAFASSCGREQVQVLERVAKITQAAEALVPGESFGVACASDATCGAHHVCEEADRICVCQKPWTLCGGVCVDTEDDTSHCGVCQNTCAAGAVCDRGHCAASAAPRPIKRLEVGAACAAGSTCAVGSSCVAGACACDAGKVWCNGACRDFQIDQHSCGECGKMCFHRTCSAGECVAGAPLTPDTVGTPRIYDIGLDATTTCRMETEAVPTRSMNTGDVFVPRTWADGGSPEQVQYNATDGGSASDAGVTFGTTDGLVVPATTGYVAEADSWSASDTAYDGGLELFSDLMRDGGLGSYFVGLAGTSMAHMHAPGSWDYPMAPLPDDAGLTLEYDGPAIVFDNSAGRFWAIATDDADSEPRVWWSNGGCKLFPSNCTFHWKTLTQAAGVNNGSLSTGGHYNIAGNPLTNGAMITFRDHNDKIRLILVHPNGSGDLVIDSDLIVDSSPHNGNTSCMKPDGDAGADCPAGEHICKCNGAETSSHDCTFNSANGERCSRLGGGKVNMVARVDGATGYALLAYDSSFVDNGGRKRFSAHVAVVDVTSASPPPPTIWAYTLLDGEQTWWSTVAGGTDAAWIYAWNANDPCLSGIAAERSPDNFLDDDTNWVGYTVAYPFPVVLSSRSGGMGDYIEGMRVGLGNGNPFGTFSVPVPTDAGCIPCQDASDSLQTQGVELP
jgi:hypothetical protein